MYREPHGGKQRTLARNRQAAKGFVDETNLGKLLGELLERPMARSCDWREELKG